MTPAPIVLDLLGKPERPELEGLPYFRFRDLPSQWRVLANQRCLLCGRSQRDGISGLWRYNHEHFVCLRCRWYLRRKITPPIHMASPVRKVLPL